MSSIARYGGFQDVFRLNDQLNRMFDLARWGDSETLQGGWTPPVDIHENVEGITLRFDVPGFDPAALDLRIENGTLTLKGERKLEREEKGYRRVERFSGAFTRSFALPTTVDPERVKAESKNGVLTVFLPRREESKPKQIKVNVEA